MSDSNRKSDLWRRNNSLLFITFIILIIMCLSHHDVLAESSPTKTIKIKIVNKPQNDNSELTAHYDLVNAYRYALLELAISKVSTAIELAYVPTPRMEYLRMLEYLQEEKLDIFWLHADLDLNQELVPIRFPIYKGFMGLRVFLINKSNQHYFSQINTLQDLKTLKAGQGTTWIDTTILKENNFNVITSDFYELLFRMLKHDRFDYFPRSVVEISRELNQFGDNQLVIENEMALYYPTLFYFYMNPKHRETAKLIEKGLYIAVNDGSFDTLFQKFYAKLIKNLDLNSRKIFYLSNSQAPKLLQ